MATIAASVRSCVLPAAGVAGRDLAENPQRSCGVDTGQADHELFLHRSLARGQRERERITPPRERRRTGRGFQGYDAGGDGLGSEVLLEQGQRKRQDAAVIDHEVRGGKLPDARLGAERRGAYRARALQDAGGEAGKVVPGLVGGLR